MNRAARRRSARRREGTARELAEAAQWRQRAWRALPLNERAAAMQAARGPLSLVFAGFVTFCAPEREAFADAMRLIGSTESELRELLGLYDAWRADSWNDVGTFHPLEQSHG